MLPTLDLACRRVDLAFGERVILMAALVGHGVETIVAVNDAYVDSVAR